MHLPDGSWCRVSVPAGAVLADLNLALRERLCVRRSLEKRSITGTLEDDEFGLYQVTEGLEAQARLLPPRTGVAILQEKWDRLRQATKRRRILCACSREASGRGTGR